jgi:hypothetical protein
MSSLYRLWDVTFMDGFKVRVKAHNIVGAIVSACGNTDKEHTEIIAIEAIILGD